MEIGELLATIKEVARSNKISQPFVVGGVPRDRLLGQLGKKAEIKDVDITTGDQGSIKFEGLNKPKGVYISNKMNIGEDKNLRASYRLIFLTLRDENGNIKKIKNLRKLIAHELTHTALNHVRWREDDHDTKFNRYNKIILKHLK